MLNIGKLAGVDSVDYYLSQVASGVEDYYLGNGEAPDMWTGTAAPDLGAASTCCRCTCLTRRRSTPATRCAPTGL